MGAKIDLIYKWCYLDEIVKFIRDGYVVEKICISNDDKRMYVWMKMKNENIILTFNNIDKVRYRKGKGVRAVLMFLRDKGINRVVAFDCKII
jgi:GTP-binding protein EngB required for normal cell division